MGASTASCAKSCLAGRSSIPVPGRGSRADRALASPPQHPATAQQPGLSATDARDDPPATLAEEAAMRQHSLLTIWAGRVTSSNTSSSEGSGRSQTRLPWAVRDTMAPAGSRAQSARPSGLRASSSAWAPLDTTSCTSAGIAPTSGCSVSRRHARVGSRRGSGGARHPRLAAAGRPRLSAGAAGRQATPRFATRGHRPGTPSPRGCAGRTLGERLGLPRRPNGRRARRR